MLISQHAQTQPEFFTAPKFDVRLKDNLIWQKERERARYEKIQDQNKAREMLERYWPWGNSHEMKPRGLRNLRLEGLFPHKDYEKAKRSVLGMGRPGGGAPNVNEQGTRVIRTKEDPLLRFQWGKDLRKCVDNTLRYRMSKEEQAQYKRELDKLVAEKFKQKQLERINDAVKDRELGYTNGKSKAEILEKIERDTEAHAKRIRVNEIKHATLRPPNQLTKNYKLLYGNSNSNGGTTKNVNFVKPFTIPTNGQHYQHQLAPLQEDGKEAHGIELVPLMVDKRQCKVKKSLGTTDVTKSGYITGAPNWLMNGQIYLQELSKQMNEKLNYLQETRKKEVESTRRHFNTVDNFWGRPGHGAPRSALKKSSIDKLLYGEHAMPVGVA